MRKFNLIVFFIFLFTAYSFGQSYTTKLGSNSGPNLTSSATHNTLLGYGTGKYLTSSTYNTCVGAYAGYGISGTTGTRNTFLGSFAGRWNTTGSYNVFIGHYSGLKNTTGYSNTFLGTQSGYANTTGHFNTFLGYKTGYKNTTGFFNTFLGYAAGHSNTTGNSNTFLGLSAGSNNISGSHNTFSGHKAGFSNNTGGSNTFLGYATGYANTTGSSNTFLGKQAGDSNTTGANNVYIGYKAGFSENSSNKLYIANNSDNHLIYGNFATNQVGINTKTLDGYTLAVNGDVGVEGELHLNGKIRGNQTGGSLKIQTDYGYLRLGPSNSLWCHFYTDMPSYYFNTEISINSGLIGSYDEDLQLRTAGINRVSILKSNGNVGIGTQNPQYKLDVNGTVSALEIFASKIETDTLNINGTASAIKLLAEEVEVKLKNNWPDYVFYNDYELPSLEEEAQFIEDNGHLSGFQSAEKMADKIPLGDISQRQQETIEKMMLHLIQMDERMKKLEEENAVLRKANNKK